MVKIQPPPTDRTRPGFSDVGNMGEGKSTREVKRDLLEISLFGCYGFERPDDPPNEPWVDPINHISEFCGFREIDGSRARVSFDWVQR